MRILDYELHHFLGILARTEVPALSEKTKLMWGWQGPLCLIQLHLCPAFSMSALHRALFISQRSFLKGSCSLNLHIPSFPAAVPPDFLSWMGRKKGSQTLPWILVLVFVLQQAIFP